MLSFFSSERMLVLLGVIWIIFGAGVYASTIFRPQPVIITWSTETEFDTAGFNIYRSETRDGAYQQVNAQLIPGVAEAAAGAEYSWEDRTAEPGRSYFYQLEDVEYSNTRTRHEPFEHHSASPSSVQLIISISGLLLGIALIVYGSMAMRKHNNKPK